MARSKARASFFGEEERGDGVLESCCLVWQHNQARHSTLDRDKDVV